MAQLLKTIEEHIAHDRKQPTLFVNFSHTYNKTRLGIAFEKDDDPFFWLNKENVNWEKREEFQMYMENNYPNITLTDVFDSVPSEYEVWSFLGTIALDVEVDSPEYIAICNAYENVDGSPKSLDTVMYIMTPEEAEILLSKKSSHEDQESL
jgi:hypothetical protein